MNDLHEKGLRPTPDSRDHGIIGPTVRPLGAIIAGMTMLTNSQNEYKGDKESFDAKFTEGERRALSDFIDEDTRLLKRLADVYIIYRKYMVLEFAHGRKAFSESPETQGMRAGYRWALKRKGAKLPILLLPKE